MDHEYTFHLFAGAGGGILGDMLFGHTIVGAVEIEKYPREVLLARQKDGILPTFPIWDDVTTFGVDKDTEEYVEYLRSIRDHLTICGGFPCQDISIAGKGKGLDGERSGLWVEMCRIIGLVRPKHIFVENSPMLIVRGLDTVLRDLAEIRYSLSWTVMGADDSGAAHKRDRFWGWGTAEEYEGQSDTHPYSNLLRCVQPGGRSITTEENFRGVGLAYLVEKVPDKVWHTPTTMDTLPPKSKKALIKEASTRPNRKNPTNLRDMVTQKETWEEIQRGDQLEIRWPTPVASEARVGCQIRREGKKGTQKSLTTIVKERAGLVKDGKIIKYPTPTSHDEKPAYSKDSLLRKDGKSRMDQLATYVVHSENKVKYPTPTRRDYKGGVANIKAIRSKDGKWDRMGNLDTFVRFCHIPEAELQKMIEEAENEE